MDITKEIERQTKEYEKKLEMLRDNNLQKLVAKEAELESELVKIKAEISDICKHLGISAAGASSPARTERKTRMGSDVIRTRITEVLKASPHGISQVDIKKQTGVSYASVINFLKNNQDIIRTEGDRKSKLIFHK